MTRSLCSLSLVALLGLVAPQARAAIISAVEPPDPENWLPIELDGTLVGPRILVSADDGGDFEHELLMTPLPVHFWASRVELPIGPLRVADLDRPGGNAMNPTFVVYLVDLTPELAGATSLTIDFGALLTEPYRYEATFTSNLGSRMETLSAGFFSNVPEPGGLLLVTMCALAAGGRRQLPPYLARR